MASSGVRDEDYDRSQDLREGAVFSPSRVFYKYFTNGRIELVIKNARPAGVPGTKDEFRVRIALRIRSIRTGRPSTWK